MIADKHFMCLHTNDGQAEHFLVFRNGRYKCFCSQSISVPGKQSFPVTLDTELKCEVCEFERIRWKSFWEKQEEMNRA